MIKHRFIFFTFVLIYSSIISAYDRCPNPTITLDPNPVPVFTWATQQCSKYDSVDVPAHAFVDQHNRIQMLLGVGGGFHGANNYRMIGSSLDQLTRDCKNGAVIYGSPPTSAPPKSYDAPGYYNNWKWMLDPWYDTATQQVYAFVHNEFDGYWEYPNKQYCSLKGITPTCWYPTILLAHSVEGDHYHLIKPNDGPIVGTPYRYVKDGGAADGSINQGIPTQTNILSSPMGDGYLYMMVDTSVGPPNAAQPTDGTCLLRSKDRGDPREWLAYDPDTKQYTNNMTVNPYRQSITHPENHVCKPLLKGVFCTAWSYNTVLHRYILICVGINNNRQSPSIPRNASFVYLLSNGKKSRDPTSWDPTQHVLMPIQWHQYPGQSLPSMIDPNGTTDGKGHGDGHNFEYSGAAPYFYYTQYHTVVHGSSPWQNRDVLRVQANVSCSG